MHDEGPPLGRLRAVLVLRAHHDVGEVALRGGLVAFGVPVHHADALRLVAAAGQLGGARGIRLLLGALLPRRRPPLLAQLRRGLVRVEARRHLRCPQLVLLLHAAQDVQLLRALVLFCGLVFCFGGFVFLLLLLLLLLLCCCCCCCCC